MTEEERYAAVESSYLEGDTRLEAIRNDGLPQFGAERIVVVGGGCYGSYYVRQLGRAARAGAGEPKRNFGGKDGAVVGHCSRHPRKLIRPRLIQLFIVPSGTPSRSASSE